MMYQDGDVIDGDEDEYDGEEVYGEEGEDVPEGVEGESEYDAEDEEVIDPHGYQDPVQEVCTEDEQTSDEGDGQHPKRNKQVVVRESGASTSGAGVNNKDFNSD